MTSILSRENTRIFFWLDRWQSSTGFRRQVDVPVLFQRLHIHELQKLAFIEKRKCITTSSTKTQRLDSQYEFYSKPETTIPENANRGDNCLKSILQNETVDLPSLDQKWQKRWQTQVSKNACHACCHGNRKNQKAYILPMFPYPSGSLHMGHVRVYTIADVLARWKSMTGHDVLNPMGWDSFGLPAENAAMERGVDPSKWTEDNILRMKGLLKTMNTDITWEREISTCDPAFYKHTQKLFLLLWQNGLAYQAKGMVNWDPVDRTVLANEQVDKEGRSWRSGAKVEQKLLTQWYVKVTAFQEALLEDMKLLSADQRWPQRVLSMQSNWIGRSKGAKLRFMVGAVQDSQAARKPIEVFTTRPDTLFGVQYLALSTSHPFVSERLGIDEGLRKFLSKVGSMSAESKQGYRLADVDAVSPTFLLDGSPRDKSHTIPVYVAPYVLDGYGEGAVMGVPGNDDRDFTFWSTNNPQAPIYRAVGPSNDSDFTPLSKPFTGMGELNEICGSFRGLTSEDAGHKIVAELCKYGAAKECETWRLRDWLISRQRYWGTPIPIIHCESCGAVPVPDDQLPVRLPRLTGSCFRGKTGNPLQSAKEWQDVPCPKCGHTAKRDTDTMDTFVDSSWYFMRFPDHDNEFCPFSTESANESLPVDIYIGGIEHAILHLLYARFMSKFLTSIGLWPKGNEASVKGEPFRSLISQGMVHGKTFTEPQTGRFLRPEELDLSSPGNPRILGSNKTPNVSFQKMSKSKYNGVDPSQAIGKFGADVVRAHILFAAPVADVLEWDDTKLIGSQRWLGRVWRHVQRLKSELNGLGRNEQREVLRKPLNVLQLDPDNSLSWSQGQENLEKILHSYSTISLNTLISDLMKLTQETISSQTKDLTLRYHLTSILLRAMAPVTPAFAEECWELLHNDFKSQPSIFNEIFPSLDTPINREHETQICAVQHNGRLKFTAKIPKMPPKVPEPTAWILQRLKETEKGNKWLKDNVNVVWKKVVIVKGGKTVNFVGS